MRLQPLGKAKWPTNPEASLSLTLDSIILFVHTVVAIFLFKWFVYRPKGYELVVWILLLGLFWLLFVALDVRKRFALEGSNLFHRTGHSKNKIDLDQVKSATLTQHECLELTMVSGETHQLYFSTMYQSAIKEKLLFLDAVEEKLPVPLTKWAFYEKLVLSLKGKLVSSVLQKWHSKMKELVDEEVARFPIKETWGESFNRKITPLAVAFIVLGCVLVPVFSFYRVPNLAYLTLLIPFAIATWLVRSNKVPTLDLVVGKGGLGIALGETFIFGEPYGKIKGFTFQASNSDVKKTFYWFQIETAHGTKITKEILVENPSSTKDLFFAKGQLPLREETPEVDPRIAPKPWEAYLHAPTNTRRSK